LRGSGAAAARAVAVISLGGLIVPYHKSLCRSLRCSGLWIRQLPLRDSARHRPSGERIRRAIATAITLVAIVITQATVPSAIGHS